MQTIRFDQNGILFKTCRSNTGVRSRGRLVICFRSWVAILRVETEPTNQSDERLKRHLARFTALSMAERSSSG